MALSLHETLPLLATLTVQVECSQLTLPLTPVVRLQLLLALQSALQEPPQLPVQVLAEVHASEQLPPAPSHPVAALPVQAHCAAEHVQADPLHGQFGPGQFDTGRALVPQATKDNPITRA